jgi:hypothetical protein
MTAVAVFAIAVPFAARTGVTVVPSKRKVLVVLPSDGYGKQCPKEKKVTQC